MEFVLFHAWGFSEWVWQPNIHQNKDSKNTLSTTRVISQVEATDEINIWSAVL